MNEFNDGSVAFLEDDDVNQQGKLRISDETVMIMVMGDFCGYCKQAAPAYHEFALKNSDKAFMTAILIDGKKTERKLGQRLSKIIPAYQGVPMFLLFKNGVYTATHDGARTVNGLEEFLNAHL